MRIRGKFVSFPDIEDAKQLIKYFRAQGIMSWESMERHVPEECGWVNSSEQPRPPSSWRALHPVS